MKVAENNAQSLPKGYKQTEVGLIPSDWEVKRLGDIAFLKRGKFTPRPRNNPIYYGGEIPFVQTGDVTKSNGKIINYTQTLNEEGLAVSALFKKGTILMTIAANIGYTGILQIDMACPDSLVAINGLGETVNDFLNFYFSFRRDKLEELATTGAQMNLNIERLSPFSIPIPPTLAEQSAIATALSDADALISSLEKLIAKKRNIKQGAMQKLLQPKEGWVVKKLGEVAEIYTGKKNNQDKVENGLYPFFVRSQTIERINTYSFDGEAILIPGEGNIGKIFHYINGKFDYHQRVYKISDFKSGYFSKYIYRYISEYFGRHAMENSVKATVDSLRLPTFQVFEIPFPPTYKEQENIATILSDMDTEITALETKLEKYKKVKLGMMQNLLTGRIRLV